MLVWAALPILVFAALASGPFRDNMPAAVEPIAQLAAVLSLFVLVCAVEAGGRNKDSGG
jgi:predicted permease